MMELDYNFAEYLSSLCKEEFKLTESEINDIQQTTKSGDLMIRMDCIQYNIAESIQNIIDNIITTLVEHNICPVCLGKTMTVQTLKGTFETICKCTIAQHKNNKRNGE